MLACSIYHDILSIESWIVKLYAAASEMRDSESHSSRVETVIELYKRISRGWKKKSLLSVQPLKRVSTEFQAQGICRTNCRISSKC